MKSLELLDSWISRKVRSWSSRVSGEERSPELLEVRRELLNDVRDQIQPTGSGKLVFPYRHVHVHLATSDEAQQQLWEGTFAQGDELQQDFLALLTEAGCAPPEGFRVEVTIVLDPSLATPAHPFRIEYSNPKTLAPAAHPLTRPPARLVVLRGEAEPKEHVLRSDRTYLGRLQEVLSETGSLRRRNDIAFAETETTVSREHAFITYDQEAGAYRLHDSRNQRGTSVVRESRQVRVPKGSTRGIELQSGDEIHLGDARLKFEIEPAG